MWHQVATPAGPDTKLRIEAHQRSGKHGDYRLTAFLGDSQVHSATYPWNVWLGHACGQLLMPAFIESAALAAGFDTENEQRWPNALTPEK